MNHAIKDPELAAAAKRLSASKKAWKTAMTSEARKEAIRGMDEAALIKIFKLTENKHATTPCFGPGIYIGVTLPTEKEGAWIQARWIQLWTEKQSGCK